MDIQQQQSPTQQYTQQPGQQQSQKLTQMQSQFSTQMEEEQPHFNGYQIQQKPCLGVGSFGKVYKAIKLKPEPYQKQEVAVKVIERKQNNNSKQYKKTYEYKSMERQIDILKKTNCHHILKFFFSKDYGRYSYIFMELACGDLGRLLKASPQGRFSEQVAIDIVKQIVKGLIELHHEGIIHRDLKPDNIFLVRENQNTVLKIGDFNLSRQQIAFSEKTAFVGSPGYMAPQLFLTGGKKISNYSYKCDIWSLGVICYMLVYGKFPWPSCNSQNLQQFFMLVEQTIKKGIDFPNEIQVSEEYKSFVRGCLQLYEEDRFDYNQINSHPIIGGDKESNLIRLYKITITNLRRKVQQSNINLGTFLQNLPQYLSQLNVYYIFKALNHEITQNEAKQLIYLLFSQSETQISQSKLVQFFKTNEFIVQNVGMIGQEVEQIWYNKILYSRLHKDEKKKTLVDKIKNKISNPEKPFQSYKFFTYWINYLTKENEKMNEIVFEKMMRNIYGKASKKDLVIFYRYFNKDNFQFINPTTFVEQFCKFFQIVQYHDQYTEQEINNMKKQKIPKTQKYA